MSNICLRNFQLSSSQLTRIFQHAFQLIVAASQLYNFGAVKYLTNVGRLRQKGENWILDTVYCIQGDKHNYGILSSGKLDVKHLKWVIDFFLIISIIVYERSE